MLLRLLGLWPSITPAFGGEDPITGNEWHHATMTWRAARAAGWTAVGPDVEHDGQSAASALAWHADYLDSYAYNPLWWVDGGLDRLKVAAFHHDDLVKLHFDDLTSTRQVQLTWARYQAGVVAGLLWAADRDDVVAARNVVGTGLHAMQDFYSHSNWVDDPARRQLTWNDARGPTSAGDPRDALHLYTGAYETPDHLTFKPHGKIAVDCSLLQRLPGWLLDLAAAPASPLANTSVMRRWRECKGGTSPRIPSVLGVEVPPGWLFYEPPGIALDSTWTTAIALQIRDLPDQPSPRTFFYATRDLAEQHSVQWLRQLDRIMGNAGLAGFWQRVKTEPRDPARDLAQYEERWRTAFGFLAAGNYPPHPDGTDEGWFLRLELTTADAVFAGTNADIFASLEGRGFLLDHMHDRTPEGGIAENRLVEYNDFEAGDRDSYVIGPFATLPSQLILRNASANLFEIVGAAWQDLCDLVARLGDDLRELGLAIIAGNADYVGWASHSLSWDQLGAMASGGGLSSFTVGVDGEGEGQYELAGLVDTRPSGDRLSVGVALTGLHCIDESGWDSFSESDEPFVVLVASSPLHSETRSAGVGPLADVDTGETHPVVHGGEGHWFLGRPGVLMQPGWATAGEPDGFGDLTRPAIRLLTGAFTGSGRTEVLLYCAEDGNWWLGRSPAPGQLSWSRSGNTAGLGDLTRAGVRLLTGGFSGPERTEVLCYTANDGTWRLGRLGADSQLSWTPFGTTANFGDLTRDSVRILTGDFTGDGRTDVLIYCAEDGNWWLGRSPGTGALAWSLAGNTSGAARPQPPTPPACKTLEDDVRFLDGEIAMLERELTTCTPAERLELSTTLRLRRADRGLAWTRYQQCLRQYGAVVPPWPAYGQLTRAGARLLTGTFSGPGRTEVLCYTANDGTWRLGRLGANSQLTWTDVGNTANFGDLTRGSVRILTADFTGDGRTDVLFYCAEDGNWWLGRSPGTGPLAWSLVGNTSGAARPQPPTPPACKAVLDEVRSFDGEIAMLERDLETCTPAERLRLSTTLRLLRADRGLAWTRYQQCLRQYDALVPPWPAYGKLTRAGVGLLTGTFSGPERTEVLCYTANDGTWRLGRLGAGGELSWTQVGAASFGDLARSNAVVLTGGFAGDGRDSVLVRVPMLTVTVPRHGGLIVPCQVWESDAEGQYDRDRIERTFRQGYDDKSINERSAFLDAVGTAIAPDWKLASVDVVGFSRGSPARYAHLVRHRTLNKWIEADKSVIVPFDRVTPTTVSLTPEPEPSAVVASIQLNGRPLDDRALIADGAVLDTCAVRIAGILDAPVTITLSAKAGVTLDPGVVTIPAGTPTAAFTAVVAPGTTGPCSITATAEGGSTSTAAFTAVALTRIELADGRPMPAAVPAGAKLTAHVALSAPLDDDAVVLVEADPGLELDRGDVRVPAGSPHSVPFVVATAGPPGVAQLRARMNQVVVGATILVEPATEVPADLVSIDSGARPLEGRRLHAHGNMIGGYSVRIGAPHEAPVVIALTASAGVTLDRASVTVPAGQTTAGFAAAIGPGVSGPCWITATDACGSTVTASFTAVAIIRIERADGTPLPAAIPVGSSLSAQVKLTGPADYNDGVQLEAGPGLQLDRTGVAVMAGTTLSRPFLLSATGPPGATWLRARNRKMVVEATLTTVG